MKKSAQSHKRRKTIASKPAPIHSLKIHFAHYFFHYFALVQISLYLLFGVTSPLTQASYWHPLALIVCAVSWLLTAYLYAQLFSRLAKSTLWIQRLSLALFALITATLTTLTNGFVYEFGALPQLSYLEFAVAYPDYSLVMFVEAFKLIPSILFATLIIFCSYGASLYLNHNPPSPRLKRWPRLLATVALATVIGAVLVFPLGGGNTNPLPLSYEFYYAKLSTQYAINQWRASPATESPNTFRINRLALTNIQTIYPQSQRPNILLIRLEEVSKNRFGLYQKQLGNTPFLRKFQSRYDAQVMVYQNHFSNSGCTDVSVPSLYTGLVPSRPASSFGRYPILWDYAKALGYQTFYYIPFPITWGHLDRKLGSAISNDGRRPTFDLSDLYHAGVSQAPRVYDNSISDQNVVDRLLTTLARIQAKDSFMGVINLKLPHHYGDHLKLLKHQPDPPVTGKYPIHDYDRAIYQTDGQIKRIITALEDTKLIDNTFIIIVADHGADQRLRRHRLVNYYQEVLGIPLIVFIPQRYQHRFQADQHLWHNNTQLMTTNVDIVPTIIDILGISHNQSIGLIAQQLDGKSLFARQQRPRITEALNTNPGLRRWNHRGFGVIYDGRYKYLVDNQQHYLFDLKADPNETKNILASSNRIKPVRQAIVDYIIKRPLLRAIYADGLKP